MNTLRPGILAAIIAFNIGFTGTANAQYYTYGQDPASQQWRQIQTENFSLIYPETMENRAQDLAHFLELIRTPLSSSLHTNPQPIPVILRNQTMLSNGFVMWAPKRIEMVTTIPYDNQATDWMKYLSVHEYRHVVQVEATNRSTTNVLSKIFGQHITGAVVGMHLPLWFLEGDAVLAETAFTRTGRGRLPAFTMPLAAQLLEKGIYSYDKATLGSYRDMVPDHYTLGYHLVAATQRKHGFEPFEAATRQVGTTPFLPASFSRGLKKITGKNLKDNYHSVMLELKEEWLDNAADLEVSDYSRLEMQKTLDYVSYINPQYIDDSTFIAFRTTPADIPRLVKIDRQGREEVLFTPGYGYYISMSYANGRAAWLEINTDPRWAYRNWTNLRIFDLETGESRLLTNKARLQAPMLSPDGDQIAAIEVDENNRWALLIFDAGNGRELHRISDPGIDFLMEPAWSDCARAIIAIAFVDGKGKSIVKTHIENPGFEHLFHAGFAEINEPVIHDCVIYFTGTWTGRDEVYAYDIDERQLYQVLASPFGATAASFSDDGSKILFSDFTASGYRISEYDAGSMYPVNLATVNDMSLRLYERAVDMGGLVLDTLKLPGYKFESKKYVKAHNSLHFHSWFPLSLDVDGLYANPGVTAFSQNLLGTTILALGYDRNIANQGHKAFIDLSLKALYPVFDIRLEAGVEDRFHGLGNGSSVKLRTSFGKVTGRVSLPLQYNHHATIYGFVPQVSTSQELYSFGYQGKVNNMGSRPVNYGLSVYAYRRLAYRDLYPRMGVSFASGYSHTPFRSKNHFTDINAGEIYFGAAAVFLPGLFRHHSFRLYAGIQYRIRKLAYFSDRIRFARGYYMQENDELFTLSASYALPLVYPDLALGSLLYAKRIKANFFADRSRLIIDTDIVTWNTIGLDVLVNAHLLRMPMPFEFGLRTMYLEKYNSFAFEFLWGVDFYAVGQALGGGKSAIPRY